MKKLILMLLFGRSVLLAPDLNEFGAGVTEIPLEAPLEAITSGAHFKIDVSEYVSLKDGMIDVYEKTEGRFKNKVIKIELFPEDGKGVLLNYSGGISIGKNSVGLILVGPDGRVPVGVKYKKAFLYTDTPLKGVKVFWVNYSK
ncbi:hypothetical protein GCM10007860_21380 [Chitiniphilus shinanonensis]|uniref:Uncharacterized protein n=1 Tax=Chitiniphilus shinanonensis TaxID=553088 RepID=A0ABQ6BZ56_9NEIS|nr:hypothetical protein [Chitiniphilus shinanonensis]GLS04989.1 hypothetical protein GCM10007860_21380 [Chitiniphilus shinanonensis]